MKKTFITLALVACAIMLISCGNNGNKKSDAKQSGTTAVTTAAAAEKALTLGDVNDQNYVELIKARCGVDPAPGEGMTVDKAYGSPGNANLKFKGA